MIVDLFAGPGGWSQGLRMLGLTDVGIEWDAAACATAIAAGHPTIRADVARYPVTHLPDLAGLIGSPPCPLFSAAGKGAGRGLLDILSTAIVDALEGRPTLARHTKAMARRLQAAYLSTPDERRAPRATRSAWAWHAAREAALTVQPARFITAGRPRWIALEQVPAVLPLWRTYARWLRSHGYSTWAGILNAADYGVPQTRRRAVLVASLDRPVTAPAQTHCKGGANTLFGEQRPWVSMAEALGWEGERPGRNATDAAPTITAGAQRRLTVSNGKNTMKHSRDSRDMVPYERSVHEPAPTLTGNVGGAWRVGESGHRRPPMRWKLNTNRGQQPDGSRQIVDTDHPAPAFTAKAGGQWTIERPATTITGDARAFGPHAGSRGESQSDNTIRLELADALTLQSFRPDYPVQGNRTKQFEQVGNAIPPLLAAHVVAAATGRTLTFEETAA